MSKFNRYSVRQQKLLLIRIILKNDTISLAAFRRWVAAQPETTVWNYYDHSNCPFACFLKSLGYTRVSVAGSWWEAEGVRDKDIPENIRHALGIATELTHYITQPALLRACR